MRILITGSLIFLLWATIASWFYVCKIKSFCGLPLENTIVAEKSAIEPSPPVVAESPKPGSLVLYFSYNEAIVSESTEADQHSILFREWLETHPEAILNIVGHTDNKGSASRNQQLGTERAENTKKYLSRKGISPEKMNCNSEGESAPVADNTSKENRAKNRRAEITIK